MLRSALFGCTILTLVCEIGHSVSYAQSVDKEAGQAAFNVGAQAFKANQFDVAARSFEQAYEFDPRPEIAFSIAQANRRQFYYDRLPWRLVRAVQLYQAYLAKLPKGPRANDAIDRVGEIEPLLRELKQRGELVPFTPPVKTELVIGADVDQAKVTVDGVAVALWEPVSVSPGAHAVVVDAPGFELASRRVVIAQGRFLPVDVELRPKPAQLTIRSEAGSELYLDGRRVGTLPRDHVTVPAGQHFISVTRRGRVPFNHEISLRRDQRVTLDAHLQTTMQRSASKWVLAGSAFVAASSAGVALWGYTAQRDANSLDAKRRKLTATTDDLRLYNHKVADVQMRTNVAIGLGLSALTIGAVGVGLLWFDVASPGTGIKAVQPLIGVDTVGVSYTTPL